MHSAPWPRPKRTRCRRVGPAAASSDSWVPGRGRTIVARRFIAGVPRFYLVSSRRETDLRRIFLARIFMKNPPAVWTFRKLTPPRDRCGVMVGSRSCVTTGFFMKNPHGGPKPSLWTAPERLFGARVSGWFANRHALHVQAFLRDAG